MMKIETPNAPITVDRERGAPGLAFALCSPYNDGLPGTAVIGAFAYKPHAEFFALSLEMVAALRLIIDKFSQLPVNKISQGQHRALLEARELLARIDGEA